MKELTIHDIETIVHRDENRVMEAKETTGELIKGMQSGCAFLNTEGGWLYVSGSDRLNDSRNDKVNDRLNDSVNATYRVIKDNPGIQRKRISELTGKSIPTTDRHIAILVKEKLIEHKDSDKTGGYYPI